MAMGKKPAARQGSPLWVTTADLPTSAGHPFFERLNRVLDEAGFDAFVEGLCAVFYASRMGRPSLRPGRYFRMLFIRYFEGLTPLYVKNWGIHLTGVRFEVLGHEPLFAGARGFRVGELAVAHESGAVPGPHRQPSTSESPATAGAGTWVPAEVGAASGEPPVDNHGVGQLRLHGYPRCQEMLSVVVAIRTIVERCTQSRRHLR